MPVIFTKLLSVKYHCYHKTKLPMLYFLIKAENELQIVPVPSDKEDAFHRRYDSNILSEGYSVQDVLRKFDDLPLTVCERF